MIYNGSFEDESDGWIGLPYSGVMLGYPEGTAADGDIWAVVADPGTLHQDVATIPGQAYELHFAMAGNPFVPEIARVNVFWGADLVGTYTWDSTGRDILNLGWEHVRIQLTASESITRLTFENPMVGGFWRVRSVMIDDVVLTTVPEPTALSLVAVGALLVGFACWRNRRQTRQSQ